MFQKLIKSHRRRRSCRHHRQGGAVVETAFCIPLILILMMGTLEVCSALYLYESLKVAAFEGIRIGTRRGGTATEVVNRANQVLASRGLVIPPNNAEYGVKLTPSTFAGMKALDPITITISAPTQNNSLFIFNTFINQKIEARVVMVREFDN